MVATDTASGSPVVLIAGLWLPRTVWDDVVAELTRLGRRAVVPPLPGVDLGGAAADLDDQVEAVLAAVDGLSRPVVVGHSAASTLAWMVADRRPSAVAGVVMIGGFPEVHGNAYADLFPITDGSMPFPGWGPFEGADARDLDVDARRRLAEAAVPVPEGVARGTVRLADERRLAVPVTVVCPEFGPEEARGWVAGGDVPELVRAATLAYVDIDSGHWPMATRPVELARILDRVAHNAE